MVYESLQTKKSKKTPQAKTPITNWFKVTKSTSTPQVKVMPDSSIAEINRSNATDMTFDTLNLSEYDRTDATSPMQLYSWTDDYTPEYDVMDFQDTLGSTYSEHEEHFLVEATELNPSECVETFAPSAIHRT